ncbi:MAG TPA: GspH/FimT family pseudopilin [Armatimonadota bacterium]|nr:GspH/FimT family pseudopilin [Armatimonadota bacterium]
MRSDRGFTLIELLVVLTILVLMAALVAPSFQRQYHTAKLNSAARDTVALMQYARTQAIVEGTTYRLNVDAEGGRLWVTFYDVESEDDSEYDDEPVFIEDESALAASRELPDIVTLAELHLGDEELAEYSDEAAEVIEAQEKRVNDEGTPYVSFSPSGTNDGAQILLENDFEDNVVVTLDPITGRTEVTEDAENDE